MEGCKKQDMSITVGDHIFESQKKLLVYIHERLGSYPLNSISDVCPVSATDSEFLLQVLRFHPSAKEKMKKFKQLVLGQAQFDEKIGRCLYILNKNNTKVDISFVKSVQNLVDEQFQKVTLKQQGSPNQKRMMGKIVDHLARIIKIYPLYSNELCRILAECYPHRVQGELFHKIYLTNSLQLAIKYPQLQEKILSIAVQKLLEIDTEIKIDHNGTVVNSKGSHGMAEKLDWLMLILFEFIDFQMKDKAGEETCFGVITVSTQGARERQESEEKFFRIFLNVFSDVILITHQSKYVQFMIFYICSLRRAFEKVLLNQLLTNITKKNPLMYKSTQINSIYYLGSFLARAKRVTDDSIGKIFEFLLNHLRNYMQKYDEQQKENNYNDGLHKIHQNLYHLLQAIMYVMCFRFQAVINLAEKTELIGSLLNILKSACSSFNALVFIAPTIQAVFIDVCKAYGHHEFVEIIEQTAVKQLSLNGLQKIQKSSEQRAQEVAKHGNRQKAQVLESYFPFDPYCLQYSDKYICEIYANWQEFLDVDDCEDSHREEEEEEEEEEEFEEEEEEIVEEEDAEEEQVEDDGEEETEEQESREKKSEDSREKKTKKKLKSAGITSDVNANNLSFMMNTSRTNLADNYGFANDKLNKINDLQYDRDNLLISDDEKNILPSSFKHQSKVSCESDSESFEATKNSSKQQKASKVNGKRRNPASSTTDNSASPTPVFEINEDENNLFCDATKKKSKRNGRGVEGSGDSLAGLSNDAAHNFSFNSSNNQNNKSYQSSVVRRAK